MSLVTESSWVETTTVQDMFLSLRKTMVLFFLLFGFVIAVTGIVLFARCRLHSVKNESFKLNKFLVRKRVVISATSSENPCYLSSQGSVQSQIDLPNHEFVPPEITIESIDQTAATTSLVSNSQYEIPLDAVWEIPRERVTISSEVLGKGEFGLVMVARVKKGSKVIRSAAKTLKESATDEDLQMLLSELLILKYVNKTPHPNIIRLVGCCTQGKMQPIYVLTERASKGSLIGILESCRDAIASNIPPLVASRNHLLNFALQIANGICHLKKLQVVHRDLACRNILVSSDFTMKIADFGLTRRTANTYYCHNKEARFPFRWLAPESLQRMKFNFASDIWSFGVVMWEIFTLGKVPYEKTSDCSAALLDQLSKGWRLPSPAGISKELYAAMLWCWEWEAELRPTPEEINEKLLAVQKVWDKEFIKIVLSVGLEDWGGTAPLVLTPSP